MTDRELLEFAAKAAGITLRYNYLGTQNANDPWLPLTDDGDALRLAVKLRIPIHYRSTDCWGAKERSTVCGELTDPRDSERYENKVAHNDDPYAATRRAIVRAAASIGEQMK